MPAQPPNPNQMSLLGQGPQHPGQIDISLSLLGSDSRDVLKAFTEQVGGLSGSLRSIVEQNKEILVALGQVVPSVGSTAAGAFSQASTPPPAPAAPSSNIDSASRPDTGIKEDSDLDSSPPGPRTSRPGFGARTHGTGVRQGQGGGSANEDDIYIPRIGEFNSQDILRQLQHVTGLGGMAARSNAVSSASSAIASGVRAGANQFSQALYGIGGGGNMAGSNIYNPSGGVSGLIKSGGNALANMIQGAPGAVSGLLNTASSGLGKLSQLAPYSAAFTQTTGIPLNPYTAIGQGTSMGLAQGGTTLGIGGLGVRIPGFTMPNLNPLDIFSNGIGGSGFLGGGGISPAGRQAVNNSEQALAYGLSPGGSSSWMRQAQNSLQSLGWSGSTMNNAAGMWGQLQASGQYGGGAIGSTTTVAPMIDQMIRYGSSSLQDFTEVLKALPTAAQAANLAVDASNQALTQFAETAKSQGSNFTQGLINGIAIQTATGMSAVTLQGAMASPLVAGPLAAQNNILPGMTNFLSAGQQAGALATQATNMSNMFYKQRLAAGDAPAIAREQADQLAAQLIGGGITAQQIKSLRTEGASKITAQANLAQGAQSVAQDVKSIQNANMLKEEAKKMGLNPSHLQGTALQGITNQDLQYHAIRSALAPLYSEAHKAGINGSEWTKIFGTGKNPTNPNDIPSRIEQWMKNQNSGNTINSGLGGGVIDLSPAAQRWFQMKTGMSWKDIANSGAQATNTPAASLPDPSLAFSSGASAIQATTAAGSYGG
jgi:hypothetical protein